MTSKARSPLPALPAEVLVPERAVLRSETQSPKEKMAAFLARVLPRGGEEESTPAEALIPWACDVLFSEHSVKAYGSDLVDFLRAMELQGVKPLDVTEDHVKVYKRALLELGMKPTTVARRLSVLRGAYRQFADKGLVSWVTAQNIAAIKAPSVQKNSTPGLTQKQAISLLEIIPTDTIQGIRDFALMSTFFITGCRVSAIIKACVGNLEFDGTEHYLQVTEKRNKKSRKILLDAARPLLAYVQAADIREDTEGPLFRPLTPNGLGFFRRHLDRKTPWRLVKKYCFAAGISPERLGGRGIGVHSLRKTAITDAIRNGAQMHEVREFAGHSDIRTTDLYFARREEDAERAARRIHIRLSHRGKPVP
jgi:site-specific recombinase XerD